MDFFLHIPKCAGSTIRTLIAQNYPASSVIGFNGNWDDIIWFRCTPEEYKRQYSIVHGHFPWNMHFGLNSDFRYFTVLRNPVDRHFSDYFYQKRWSDAPLHSDIVSRPISLESWAAIFSESPLLSDYQVRYIVDDLFSEQIPFSYADFAYERVRDEFCAFGIAERFSESVLLIAKALGWKRVLFESRNVGERTNEVSSTLRRQAAQHLEIDIRFYDRCLALFEDRVQAGGVLLARAAAELTAINLAMTRESSQQQHMRFVLGENEPSYAEKYHGILMNSSAIADWLNS
jgi:hypothetical protein